MWEDGGFSATTDVPAPSEEEAGGDPGTASLACQFPEPPPEEAGSDPATAGLVFQFPGFALLLFGSFDVPFWPSLPSFGIATC